MSMEAIMSLETLIGGLTSDEQIVAKGTQRDTAYLWGARLTYRVHWSKAISKYVEIQARI